MRSFLSILFIAVVFVCLNPDRPQAASQAECAIWLCLPGGFPSGCSAARSAFHHRIKHRRSPLPSLSSCTTGPDGVGTDGRYKLGHEAFEACKDGYSFKTSSSYNQEGICFPDGCDPGQIQAGRDICSGYAATRRAQPNYIKIWVEGEYLGQYWY